MSQRIDRVDALLRQEIGGLLAREVQDPGVGFVTVTEVEASPDLRHARVWVSVIGSPEEQQSALRALRRAMPFVRHELGVRLRLKRIPALHVELDDSMSRGTRVLRILDELERGETPEGLPAVELLPTPVPRLPREGDAPEPPGAEPGTAGDARAERGSADGGPAEPRARRPRRQGSDSRRARRRTEHRGRRG